MWLERAGREQQGGHEPLPRRTFRYARNHRARLAFASLLMALTIAACTISVEQEETLGYTLSGTFRPDSSAMAVMDSVRSLDGVIGVRWGTTREDVSEGSESQAEEKLTFVAELPDFSGDEAEQQRQELEALSGVVSVDVAPMEIKVRRRLYQAVLPSSLRPPVWRATARLRSTARLAEVERVVERHLNKLQFHSMDAKILAAEEGRQKLVVSSTAWGSIGRGFRRLEQFQRDMQPFLEEGGSLGFVISGRWHTTAEFGVDPSGETSRPATGKFREDSVLRQIQATASSWMKHAVFGSEGEWFTFEFRNPGVSHEQADVWAEELRAIDGIDEVNVKPIGQ